MGVGKLKTSRPISHAFLMVRQLQLKRNPEYSMWRPWIFSGSVNAVQALTARQAAAYH
jgi:hypothetical protein